MTKPPKKVTGTENQTPADRQNTALRSWDNEGGAPSGGHAKRPRDPVQLAKTFVDIATAEVEEAADSKPGQRRPYKKRG
jgi:hypothetical protein